MFIFHVHPLLELIQNIKNIKIIQYLPVYSVDHNQKTQEIEREHTAS